MDILFGLNDILDLLIYEREHHDIAEQCDDIIEKFKWRLWISASSVDNLYYLLLNEAKRLNVNTFLAQREFYKYMEKVKVFSVTGKSVLDSIKVNDMGEDIIYSNFMRIAPQGVIISRDREFQKYPNTISPYKFVEENEQAKNHPIKKQIPLLDLQEQYRYMLEDIDHAVFNILAETKYIFGPQVKELENKIAQYIGTKHCIGICSGTDALVLSLRALAIKIKGQEFFDKTDEIITTPFTFTATGDAILRAGATPVFVDIDPGTYNIDPIQIREYINQHLTLGNQNVTRVVGILPVHLYGQSCDMDEITDIANEYNLFVVEDVAQAFGGEWKGRKLGSLGITGAFSFFPSKNLGGAGDGGMVASNDDDIAELIRMLLRHGGKDKYNVDHIGYNARLDTLQASILLEKLKYIDEFNKHRRRIAEIYTDGLKDLKELMVPFADSSHVYHQYTVRTSKRNELQAYLKNKGITTMVYYPCPLHKMKVFGEGRSKKNRNLEVSEKATQSVLSLPIEPLLCDDEVKLVIAAIRDFMEKNQ